MSGKAETEVSQILTQRVNGIGSVRKVKFLVDQFGLQSCSKIDYSLNLKNKRADMLDLAVAIDRSNQQINFPTAKQLIEKPGESSFGLIPIKNFYLPKETERAMLLLDLFDHDHPEPWSDLELGNYLHSAANLFAFEMNKIIGDHQIQSIDESVKHLLKITGQRVSAENVYQVTSNYNHMLDILHVSDAFEYARVVIASSGKYHNLTVLTEFAVNTGTASQAYLFRAVESANRFDQELILKCAQVLKRYLVEFDANFMSAFDTRISQLNSGAKTTPLEMKPPVLLPAELIDKLIID